MPSPSVVRTLLAAAAVVLVVGCSSTTVSTDFDRQADFSQYRTFAWYEHGDDGRPREQPNQIVDGRIRRAIAQSLIDRGLTQAAPGSADLLVTYYVGLDRELRMYSTGYGYGYWYGWGGYRTDVYEYVEGTLVVDLIDAAKDQLVWRGTLTKALSEGAGSEENVREVVSRLMSAYPSE